MSRGRWSKESQQAKKEKFKELLRADKSVCEIQSELNIQSSGIDKLLATAVKEHWDELKNWSPPYETYLKKDLPSAMSKSLDAVIGKTLPEDTVITAVEQEGGIFLQIKL